MMVIIWLAIIAGVVFFIQYFYRQDMNHPGYRNDERGESAEEILKRRYMSGELSREEYLSMSADLKDLG